MALFNNDNLIVVIDSWNDDLIMIFNQSIESIWWLGPLPLIWLGDGNILAQDGILSLTPGRAGAL